MQGNFNLVSNLPYIIFALCFFVVFVLFIFSAIVLLLAGGIPEKIQKGRKVLLSAFYCLFITLIIVLIFYSVSFIVKKTGIFQPKPSSEEFPLSQALNLPPGPKYIVLGERYFFSGLWSLRKYNKIERPVIYTILCKKGDNYDIMDIESTTGTRLLNQKEYFCWLEKCQKKANNIYVAILATPLEKYGLEQVDAIKKELIDKTNPPCLVVEEE